MRSAGWVCKAMAALLWAACSVAPAQAQDKPDPRAAFQSANIEVTVRDGTVRVSPALFNNADDIERCLATTKKLV